MFRIGLICEGPADREIIKAILDHYFDDYVSNAIQPPTGEIGGEAGPFGGGWEGVRTWCRQEAAQGSLSQLTANNDIIIIQVDADVALDAEIDRFKPCPPAKDTSDGIHSLILEWLSVSRLPDGIVSCVPAMATETWAFVALFPKASSQDGHVECRTDIKAAIRKLGKGFSPKLVVSQKGKLKNQSKGYQNVSHRISKEWLRVTKTCSEAKRFHDDLCTTPAMLGEIH